MPQIFLSSKNISLTHFILGLFLVNVSIALQTDMAAEVVICMAFESSMLGLKITLIYIPLLEGEKNFL